MSDLVEVQLLNDDFTPWQFVITILTDVFGLSAEQAKAGMIATHEQGLSRS